MGKWQYIKKMKHLTMSPFSSEKLCTSWGFQLSNNIKFIKILCAGKFIFIDISINPAKLKSGLPRTIKHPQGFYCTTGYYEGQSGLTSFCARISLFFFRQK